MPSPINVIDHPICFANPRRRAPSAWLEHIPFAMWLTSALRPRRLVELGTHYGTSYCAFCQAIDALGLPTRAFAVDSWEGDPHSGGYRHDVLDDLRQYHDPRYARFSTLLQMTFDEALSGFADGEIDLLHIDGYHTYEVVRHDFETWQPKLSDRGIVLFHDIEERHADFGVWRLWEELSSDYPSFSFIHEHGLGVLAIGTDLPVEVRALLDLRGPEIGPVRGVFRELGRRLRLETELENELAQRDAARAGCSAYLTQLEATRVERDTCGAERDAARAELVQSHSALRATAERLASVQKERDELLSSQSWRAFHQAYLLAARIGPKGSRRWMALKGIARLMEVLGRELATGLARRWDGAASDRNMGFRGHGATLDDPARYGPGAQAAAAGTTPHSNQRDVRGRVH
jgi:hypothetical protein